MPLPAHKKSPRQEKLATGFRGNGGALYFLGVFAKARFGFFATAQFLFAVATFAAKTIVGMAQLFEVAQHVFGDLGVGKAHAVARLVLATARAVATRFGFIFLFEKIEFHVSSPPIQSFLHASHLPPNRKRLSLAASPKSLRNVSSRHSHA
jgi:hypothetical protein